MELIPRSEYVVLKEAEAIKDESTSGIIIPEDMVGEDLMNQGKIVKLPLNYKGDLEENTPVVFRRHLFEDIIIEGKKFLLGKLSDVIGILYIPDLNKK